MTPDEAARLPYRPCVGVMLINGEGLIFAGQRIDSGLSAWQMPQGGIDPGEDPRTAAFRELQEETGISPDRVALIDETSDWLRYDLPDNLIGRIWGGRYRGQEQLWFLMRFLGRDIEITLDTAHPEFSEWRWLSSVELLDGIVPFKRDIYRRVIADFRPHLA